MFCLIGNNEPESSATQVSGISQMEGTSLEVFKMDGSNNN
jgi:hypothetical protein